MHTQLLFAYYSESELFKIRDAVKILDEHLIIAHKKKTIEELLQECESYINSLI